MKNNIIYKIISISTLAGVLAVSCTSSKNEVQVEENKGNTNEVQLTQAQFELAEISVGKVEKRTIGSELKVNGTIDVPPRSNVSISMPYGGFVKRTEMLPGTKVKKGQFLVSIENPEFIQFQQEYLESLASQEYLKEEFERQEKLYKEKVASGKKFKLAKSNYQANEVRISSMEARLELIGLNIKSIRSGKIAAIVNIYSPVSGSIRDVYTNVGKYIGPQDVIMDITNSDDLHVELTVYENDIPRVKEGQQIRFTIANRPDDWREATIFLIGSGVREDRSVTVHGHLKEKQPDLIPGMYVSAKIETESNKNWTVPNEAIVRFSGKNYVFVSLGSKGESDKSIHHFEMKEVIKGNAEDGYTAVRLDLSDEEIGLLTIVTNGAFILLAKGKNKEEED